MRDVFWVSIGGMLGANARYFLSVWVASRFGADFPYGTFVVNVSGSFALGLILGLLEERLLSPAFRLTAAVGFLGAYTTFSTFTYETIRLIEAREFLLASVNALGSVVLGLAAAIAGIVIGRSL